ncbi:hypothetical protein AB0H96_55895 [Nonomuraea fuscirosea]
MAISAIEARGDGGGIAGAISRVPDQPSPSWRGPKRDEGYPGHVTVFVEVDDVDIALQQAESLGETRMQGPDPLQPGIEIGKFTDPEGHLIGLVTRSDHSRRFAILKRWGYMRRLPRDHSEFMKTTNDRAVAASHSVDPDGLMVIFNELMARIAGRFGRVEPRPAPPRRDRVRARAAGRH